jgi:hypothetical protein
MTLRRYSRLTSSSLVDAAAAEELLGVGDARRAGLAAGGDMELAASLLSWRDDQYPTPGLRDRSRRAADDWTFLSSSRKV